MKKYISKDDSPSSMFVEHLRSCFSDLKVDFTMMWKIVTSYRAKNGIALHLAICCSTLMKSAVLNTDSLILANENCDGHVRFMILPLT